jgi:hypothetical protein
MSLELQKVAVIGRGKIWSRGKDIQVVIQDESVVRLLKPYIGRHVDAVVAGVPLRARLLYEQPKRGKPYLGFFLPRRLRPLWEKMRQGMSEVDVIFIVESLNIPMAIIGNDQQGNPVNIAV